MVALQVSASVNQAHVTSQLNANPTVGCVLIGGQSTEGYVIAAIEDVGREDTIKAGTFDYSTDVGDLVTQGKLEFEIHQQQYYQGYVPVVLLALAQHRNLKLDESILFAVPFFITVADVAPRQCELTPTCSANEMGNSDTVLRVTSGTDMETLWFATATFGMSAAGILEVWNRSPVSATVVGDCCLPLSAATSAGSAVVIEERSCFLTTKARNAPAAGWSLSHVRLQTLRLRWMASTLRAATPPTSLYLRTSAHVLPSISLVRMHPRIKLTAKPHRCARIPRSQYQW
jgi:hypothetical protein